MPCSQPLETDISFPNHNIYTSQGDNSSWGSQGQVSSPRKIEFPQFDGSEPRVWIKKCMRDFQVIYTVPEDQTKTLTSVHLDGKEELWFRGSWKEKECLLGRKFIQGVYEHFDGIDPGMIFRGIQQVAASPDSVTDYLKKFE
ncbi:hypothetical protein Salat_1443100 [Sesamum alatum]|uniref:Uncharacterized protein n=1 Tax=Sesamum alatum TaxID=300844 RepID=A0AAE1YAM9_9LAMI|nr:hypothetical protein Salat_1443100 [Sesamum alatum]